MFMVWDAVLLKLQPYAQSSVALPQAHMQVLWVFKGAAIR